MSVYSVLETEWSYLLHACKSVALNALYTFQLITYGERRVRTSTAVVKNTAVEKNFAYTQEYPGIINNFFYEPTRDGKWK